MEKTTKFFQKIDFYILGSWLYIISYIKQTHSRDFLFLHSSSPNNLFNPFPFLVLLYSVLFSTSIIESKEVIVDFSKVFSQLVSELVTSWPSFTYFRHFATSFFKDPISLNLSIFYFWFELSVNFFLENAVAEAFDG